MKKRAALMLLALLPAALGLSACSGDAAQTTAAATKPPTTAAATEPQTTEPFTTEPPAPEMLKRFEALYERNSDLVGWISVPGTLIDYPVVYCKDNQFYLDYDFDLNKNPDGTIFLAKENGILQNNRSLSLFGNHLANGLMFSDLHKYKDLYFYMQSPVFSFDTLYEEAEYKIFAVFYMAGNMTDEQFYYYPRGDFADDADFLSHVRQLTVRSVFDLPVEVKAGDQIVIMTCCTYETDNLRIAVAGRKVRPDESPEVDVELAVKNENPLYPQKWYDKFGGHPPPN